MMVVSIVRVCYTPGDISEPPGIKNRDWSAIMAGKQKPNLVADDVVVTMAYNLTVDGDHIDSTEEGEALVFIQGYGSIIPGLENSLYGMMVGSNRPVRVPAEDAYGEYDLKNITSIPISEFPEELDLTPGLELEMEDKDGDTVFAKIVSIGRSRVKMDFNHPLAGKDLDFDVTILDLRQPTPQELDQGFVD
jgi:FKBP-type peptidyl-prolyl cis-trans isomerase SlyD